MSVTVWTPDVRRRLAEDCADDWPRLMYDGFGIMVSPEQEEAHQRIGTPGPRRPNLGEFKNNWLSGGQRGGKTVFAAGMHLDACLYKRGLDATDRRYWTNYQYATLAIAPTDALTLRLWQIGDEVSKGANDAQYDRKARRSRGGAFIGKFTAGRDSKGNGIWRFSNGGRVEFRSSEGWAYRLEGGQWWFITWDEWASQPDREIRPILVDVLFGRARDHDAKIMPMAWPKKETEHHLISVIREIEAGRDPDSHVVYLASDRAPWTNKEALAVELRQKDTATVLRTIKGQPAGGASVEFKPWMLDNMRKAALPRQSLREEGFAYFHSWDIGIAHDDTIGGAWRIPIVGGRRVVSPEYKARLVNTTALVGGDGLTPDAITFGIQSQQQMYGGDVALDATGLGGIMAVRALRDMNPKPYAFVARSNDRLKGNIRLAAITNGLEMLTWGRPPQEAFDDGTADLDKPWGLIETPNIVELYDQLANFDRDAKEISDDWVWMMLIGLWYIRRFWVIGEYGDRHPVDFDVRRPQHEVVVRRRGRERSRFISPSGPAVAPEGIRYIRPRR